MPIIDIHAAQTQLPDLLEAAGRGENVVISQDGKPIAQLIAARPANKLREPGSMAGQIWMAEDFDGPLPDEILAAFEGK